MRLTPIEIRQHRFHTRLRGFDIEEVKTFLDVVVGDFEEIVRENAQLRREAEKLARELDTFRGREKTIQETLTTVQTVVDQLRRTAIKESEVLVAEAELQAERLMRETHEERSKVLHEITEMRHARNQLENDLSRTLEGYTSLVESYRAARGGIPSYDEKKPEPGE